MYNRLVDLIQYEAMVREKNDARKTANIRVAKFDRELSGNRTAPDVSVLVPRLPTLFPRPSTVHHPSRYYSTSRILFLPRDTY
jgi:hypothetical protein